jgi:MerR family transcriptional regulator, light-induced transcriptional regulator
MSIGLLSTAEAARRLGVTTTTIKRWADDGRLPHMRTAGGHRRFRSEDVRSLSAPSQMALTLTGTETDDSVDLVDLLLARRGARSLEASLMNRLDRPGGWVTLVRSVGVALATLGERWADGRIDIHDEHAASARLGQALAALSEQVLVTAHAPAAVLIVPEGEEHTLGLSLLLPLVRTAGFRPVWLGRATPAAEVVKLVSAQRAQVVLLSASVASADVERLSGYLEPIATACALEGILALVGGSGAWPAHLPTGAQRVTLEHLPRILATLRDPGR